MNYGFREHPELHIEDIRACLFYARRTAEKEYARPFADGVEPDTYQVEGQKSAAVSDVDGELTEVFYPFPRS